MRYIHHLVDSQKFRFVSDLNEIGHFEMIEMKSENMNKTKITTIENKTEEGKNGK